MSVQPDNLKAQILSWHEIKGEVSQVNRKFADVIDSLDLQDGFEFCRVDYPYGAAVFDNGRLSIPNDRGRLVPIDDPSISNRYKKFLDYGPAPLGMVLNRSLSLSLEEKEQFVPLHLFYSGQFFGLWELFDSEHSLFNRNQWNLYSGTRSLFSTNKISNLKKYQPLKRKFNLKSRLPSYLKDHYFLFAELANHPSFASDWGSTVLFFSKDFQEQLIKKNTLFPLQTYFLKYVWQQSMPWRFNVMMKIVWNQISNLLQENNFKNFGLQLGLLKHISKISLGASPCFVSDDPDEITAPLSLIKEILIDEYKVDFCPTIMVPGHLSNEKNRTGYYSVNESIPVEEAYMHRSKRTSIETMRSICELYEFIKTNVFNKDIYIDNQMVKHLIEEVKLDFFHSIFDNRELLSMSSILPDQDKSLTRLPKKYGKSVLPFNENGSFFRGLIRITK